MLKPLRLGAVLAAVLATPINSALLTETASAADMPTLNTQIRQAVCTQNWGKAVKIVEQMIAITPSSNQMQLQILETYQGRMQSLNDSRANIPNWSEACFAATVTSTVAQPIHSPTRRFDSITVRDAASLVTKERGRATVVMLYESTCPRSRRLFPSFVELAKSKKPHNVSFLALSTDKAPKALSTFLGNTQLPFRSLWVKPWQPGQLNAAMKPLGIRIGKNFDLPLIAVIEPNGRVVSQWQGARDIRHVEAALNSVSTYAR